MKYSSGQRFFWILGVMALAALLLSAGAAVAADATIKWENYDGVDGTNAVVATQGSNTFVAYGDAAGVKGNVAMYNASGKLLGDLYNFDLNGGRVTAIAVSGSKVYLVGHYNQAGSGNETVFSRVFGASKKGLRWIGENTSPTIPNAGLHPIGVKALGSKVVMFYNTQPGDVSSVQGKYLGVDPKTGHPKWGPFDFSAPTDQSSKVNAIAINGSQVAAAGTSRDSDGNNWFRVVQFSATKELFLVVAASDTVSLLKMRPWPFPGAAPSSASSVM